jgi:hypothetical protein
VQKGFDLLFIDESRNFQQKQKQFQDKKTLFHKRIDIYKMSEARALFVGISTKDGLKWNEAKGRVANGTLFVQVHSLFHSFIDFQLIPSNIYLNFI